MSFSPDFTVSQSVASPTKIYVADSSTGTDAGIASRRVYFSIYNGTYLVPVGTTTPYVVWPLADAFITPEVLLKDYAIQVIVQWLDSGHNVLYTANQWRSFDLNNRLGLFSVLKKAVSNPIILQDANYLRGIMQEFVYIYAAKDAVEVMADLYKAQSALDKGKQMLDHQQNYF